MVVNVPRPLICSGIGPSAAGKTVLLVNANLIMGEGKEFPKNTLLGRTFGLRNNLWFRDKENKLGSLGKQFLENTCIAGSDKIKEYEIDVMWNKTKIATTIFKDYRGGDFNSKFIIDYNSVKDSDVIMMYIPAYMMLDEEVYKKQNMPWADQEDFEKYQDNRAFNELMATWATVFDTISAKTSDTIVVLCLTKSDLLTARQKRNALDNLKEYYLRYTDSATKKVRSIVESDFVSLLFLFTSCKYGEPQKGVNVLEAIFPSLLMSIRKAYFQEADNPTGSKLASFSLQRARKQAIEALVKYLSATFDEELHYDDETGTRYFKFSWESILDTL